MRQHTKLFFILFLISLILHACNPCDYLECATGDSRVRLRFISAATGKNLVFGPNKTYDTSQIKFFTTRGRDTAFIHPNVYYDNAGFNDTALQVDFFLIDTAYIRFSSADVDTVTFSTERYDTKCCKNQVDITGVSYNSSMQLMTNKGVLEIRK